LIVPLKRGEQSTRAEAWAVAAGGGRRGLFSKYYSVKKNILDISST
jgi:hypothetical protein